MVDGLAFSDEFDMEEGVFGFGHGASSCWEERREVSRLYVVKELCSLHGSRRMAAGGISGAVNLHGYGVNGRYFNDNDEDDLSEKIKWFFHNPERSKEMGQTSEEIIRNEININTVIKEYEKALDYCAKKIIYKTKNSHQLV